VSGFNRLGTAIIILLIAIIAGGGIFAWSRYSPARPIAISLPPVQEQSGEIYIGGVVTNPGYYPYIGRDSLATLLEAAGGTTGHADPGGLRLYVTEPEEVQQPQKININRAEVWLLKALPGIGDTLARRIVDYRQQHGPFLNIHQIVKVAGVGEASYEQIKHLITVAGE
jgi:competence protein ComEA